MDYLFKPIVLVTGFGPFVNHPVNASWEAVKLMNKEELEKKHHIELVLLEIPVTYQNVDEFVPALWQTHEPKLMIHVGVSSIATQMTLEKQAHRKGYQRMDYFNECPANHICPVEGAIRLHTQLDIERICQEYNNSNPEEKTSAVTSLDAGRFLCEYIYYTSLSHDNTRTLFVHVPDMPVYSSEQTARGLERILDLCMSQILEAENAADVAEKMEQAKISENEALGFQSRSFQILALYQVSKMLTTLESFTTSLEDLSNDSSSKYISSLRLKDFSSNGSSKMKDISLSEHSKFNDTDLKTSNEDSKTINASSDLFDERLKKALNFRMDLLKLK